MSRRAWTLALATAIGVVAIATVFSTRRHAPPSPGPATSASAPASPTAQDRGDEEERDRAAASRDRARRARDAMRTAIVAALRERSTSAPAAAPPAPSATARSRPKGSPAEDDDLPQAKYEASYIREHFRADMFPLIKSCYGGALKRRPTLAGKLVLRFNIVGDASVGGVVEGAEIAEGSDIQDPEMETCVRESLMTLTFDKPPKGGGVATVTYPLEVSPDPDPDDTEDGTHGR